MGFEWLAIAMFVFFLLLWNCVDEKRIGGPMHL